MSDRLYERSSTGPQGFRWKVAPAGPPMTAALMVGEAVRAAVYRQAEPHGLLPLPEWFHGMDDPAHSHAMWLSEDADRDGRIDHVTLFCANGLPGRLLPVLAAGADLWFGGLGAFRLEPSWMGRPEETDRYGPARQWESVTPYLTPRWHASRRGAADRERERAPHQIVGEIEGRGIGRVLEIHAAPALPCGLELVDAARFITDTPKRRPPGDAKPLALRLVFDRPVRGPLALGFGAHFGLGLLEPAERQSGTGRP